MSKSEAAIIDREIIELNDSRNRMLVSGWGEDTMENSIVEKITYLSDNLKVKGYIAYPKNPQKKYPCIIWNRGGFEDKGTIDVFTAKEIFGQLASWGYVVFASQYRGNAGGEGKDEFGGDDVNDVLNLMPLAEELDFADNENWGIEGWSRGGMMTYLALTKSNKFKCAVTVAGIANLRCSADESPFMKKLFETMKEKHSEEEFRKICESRSIVNFPEKLSRTTNMMIIHGTEDNRVLPHNSLDLSYHLLKHKIPFRLVMLEGGDHFLRKHRREVDKMRRNWYERFLNK